MSEQTPAGAAEQEQCTCGNLGPEQGIPSPLCPVHKHAWNPSGAAEVTVAQPATSDLIVIPTGAAEPWTAEYVRELFNDRDVNGDWELANAHNAAIAKERDENWRNAYDNLLIDYTQLREQLAAEREQLHAACDSLHHTQLQLAAAVEALRQIATVEADEDTVVPTPSYEIAINALAAVKEGK